VVAMVDADTHVVAVDPGRGVETARCLDVILAEVAASVGTDRESLDRCDRADCDVSRHALRRPHLSGTLAAAAAAMVLDADDRAGAGSGAVRTSDDGAVAGLDAPRCRHAAPLLHPAGVAAQAQQQLLPLPVQLSQQL